MNNNRVTLTEKCETNIKHYETEQRSKRRLEHRLHIVKQLPFHFAPQHSRIEQNR